MIRRIRANHAGFKEVTFTPGLNIVLAERTKDATARDSRNGLGKSTLLEILHFCLGSSPRKTGEGLLVADLHDWIFYLDILLNGHELEVERSVADPSRIRVRPARYDGGVSLFGEPLPVVATEMSVKEWCAALAHAMFGIAEGEDTAPDDHKPPTFRLLFPYFCRLGKPAYSNPFEHFPKMRAADVQLAHTFLLGLEWRHAAEWATLREKASALDSLLAAARQGLVDGIGSIGELEAQRALLASKLDRQRADLAAFRVHPQYREIEERANLLTQQIALLADESVKDRNLLDLYLSTVQSEQPPASGAVQRVYEQAGVLFPDSVRVRLNELEAFHAKLIENRRNYLRDEMTRLRSAIDTRSHQMDGLDAERASLMHVLASHQALEAYTRHQSLVSQTQSQLSDIGRRIDQLKSWERGKADLGIAEAELHKRAREDLSERHEQRDHAVTMFGQNTEALYREAGNLVVDVTKSGFKFAIKMPRSRSGGISNMKIFCYDLMMAQLWAERRPSPGFLVHDSTIFEGVDERQVAHAIELIATEASSRGFQYIMTLNSDSIPVNDLSPAFDFSNFVRLTLTDADESTGLMGMRYPKVVPEELASVV